MPQMYRRQSTPQTSTTSSTVSYTSTIQSQTPGITTTSTTSVASTTSSVPGSSTSGGKKSSSVSSARAQGASLSTSPITLTSTLAESEPAGATVTLSGNALAQVQGSGGISSGAAAGIAIATAVVGALLAVAVAMVLARKKNRHRKTQSAHGTADSVHKHRHDEKYDNVYSGNKNPVADFDLDRLLPQPLDDRAVGAEVQKVFSAIDAHVENFYTDKQMTHAITQTNIALDDVEMLANPVSRLFMLKKIICQTVLESISPACPADRSLLPAGFCNIAGNLQELDLANHANTLCWSRLRTSFAHLVRSDALIEKNRLGQAISIVVDNLTQDLQPFEMPGQSVHRRQDLDAICRAGAELGKLILTQPAVWRFEWTQPSIVAHNSRRTTSRFVYFPALLRLTDNKGNRERSPNMGLQAKIMH